MVITVIQITEANNCLSHVAGFTKHHTFFQLFPWSLSVVVSQELEDCKHYEKNIHFPVSVTGSVKN